MIRVKGLKKAFGDHLVLKGIDYEIKKVRRSSRRPVRLRQKHLSALPEPPRKADGRGNLV